MMLSERVQGISESKTLAITSKAKAMKKNGVDIINFGAGGPDFDTPENIKEAAKKAMEKGFIRISYVTSLENIEKGLDRLEKYAGGLK